MAEDTGELQSFELDKDQLEALRLESQSVSPKEKREFDELVKKAHHMFLNKMDLFLEKDPLSDEKLAQKFIYVDPESYSALNRYWVDMHGKTVETYANEGSARAFITEGNYVATLPEDVWNALSIKLRKELAKVSGLSEDQAKARVNNVILTNTILHETCHLYQRDSIDLPLWLIESQAYWVAREAAPPSRHVNTPMFDAVADFYQSLLDKFGNYVHQLCFEKNKNMHLLYQVEKEFTPEVQKRVFPEYSITPPSDV